MKKFLPIFLLIFSLTYAQDTISYPWPVTPFNSTQTITGTFCEYRNTLSSNHFHNGTDIPKTDGSPVYPVHSGTVYTLATSTTDGSNAYVRIKTQTPQGWKHISYVHIEPNPTLSPGMAVTVGVTVLGNILSGQRHVHLTERELVQSENSNGVEIGAHRKNGGLTPYIDTYPPEILWVKFYQDNSSVEFTNNKIYGLVDIVTQIAELSGPGSPNSGSTTNNGVYHTGFKILSADKSTVVYTPPVNGTRFKFDYKPFDTYTNNVFTLNSDLSNHKYILTNGIGNHGVSTSSSSRTINNNYFSSTTLPPGNYQLMVFAIDTRDNADTVYTPFEISSQDVVPPAPPFLKSVVNDSTNKITISWYANTEPDLKGYRLYSSINGTTWLLQKNETVLNGTATKYSFTGISSTTPVYFKLTAVDSAAITNESGFSDVYGLRPNIPGQKILVIDAFDRISGSYKLLSHPFAMTAGQSINARYETAHNKAVVDGSVALANYNAVVWLFGDESTSDETFGAQEQAKAIAYVQQGGKIFASGSEIGWDLDRASGPSQSDRDFLHTYFKTAYAGDDANNYTINGSPAGFLNGVSFTYGDTLQGSPYVEDYPDYFLAMAGVSFQAAYYGNGLVAAVAGDNTLLLGIPFETIHAKTNRDALMTKVLNYFGITTSVAERQVGNIPSEFTLEQNYPNPFNPTTTIRFTLQSSGFTSLKVFDVLGKEVAILVNERKEAGKYAVQFSAGNLPSGIYFYRLDFGTFSETKKLVLMK